MMAPVFLRRQAARASRHDSHDNTIDAALELTHVDVLWIRRRVVSFAPDSIFAFLRWVSNAYGSVQSRIDILRAVAPGEGYVTAPDVPRGSDSLLHISGWPRVEKVLQAIEVVQALSIDPADAAPDYGSMFTSACPPVIGRNLTHRHDITPGCGASG